MVIWVSIFQSTGSHGFLSCKIVPNWCLRPNKLWIQACMLLGIWLRSIKCRILCFQSQGCFNSFWIWGNIWRCIKVGFTEMGIYGKLGMVSWGFTCIQICTIKPESIPHQEHFKDIHKFWLFMFSAMHFLVENHVNYLLKFIKNNLYYRESSVVR